MSQVLPTAIAAFAAGFAVGTISASSTAREVTQVVAPTISESRVPSISERVLGNMVSDEEVDVIVVADGKFYHRSVVDNVASFTEISTYALQVGSAASVSSVNDLPADINTTPEAQRILNDPMNFLLSTPTNNPLDLTTLRPFPAGTGIFVINVMSPP